MNSNITKIPHLQLNSMPERMRIHSVELDLTWDCNLGCIYCYKGERHQINISKQTAFDAVIWLIYASAHAKDITLFLMGGEPLLQFELIKQLVPFAKRRAKQHNKNLFVSTTTNCTLVTDEVLSFYKKWKIGFHTSIDGIPEVQNHNRPFISGNGTSDSVTQHIPSILEYRKHTTARATVLPENVQYYADNYLYFRKLGYTNIALIPSEFPRWDTDSIRLFEQQLCRTAELWKNDLRQGNDISVSFFHITVNQEKPVKTRAIPCGAGRGLVSIDVHGNIWPCNRWNPHGDLYWNQWRLGNIYTGFHEESRSDFVDGMPFLSRCEECTAAAFCGGGCHASNITSTGNIRIQHNNACTLNRIQAGISQEVNEQLYAEKCSVFMKRYYAQELKDKNPQHSDIMEKNHAV